MHPLDPDHIMMFPNIKLWDEHIQKKKLMGMKEPHDMNAIATEYNQTKVEINSLHKNQLMD